MRPSVLALLILTTLGAAPALPAQVAAAGEGYSFRVKYVEGQTATYAATTEVTMTGGPGGLPPQPKIELTMKQEVLSVKDGIATVKIATTGGPAGTDQEQTIQIDERGKTVGQPEGASPTGSPAGLPTGYPDRPVKVGETWSAETDVPNMPGGGKMKVDTTFVGLKEVDGKTVAQLDLKMLLTGQATLEGTGTVLLDPADGQMISTSIRNTMTLAMPGSGEPMTVTIAMDIKRQ